ncbi:MAG: c-type cytochrome [Deltaproteobacteria bacterium]|nr:c-type cytochrome [Deltaproteobacteria bacterium]
MKIVALIFALAGCLVFVGCSKEDSKTTAPQVSTPAPQPAEKAVVVQQVEKVVEQTKEKVAQVTEQAKEKVAEVTEQAKEKAAVVTEQAQEKVAQVTTQAQGLVGAALPSASSSGSISGETVYNKSCGSCHKFGVIGAPKTGDKAAWAALSSNGIEPLVQTAINGKGKMPARGGNSKLTDDEVKAAVEYMVEQSR